MLANISIVPSGGQGGNKRDKYKNKKNNNKNKGMLQKRHMSAVDRLTQEQIQKGMAL